MLSKTKVVFFGFALSVFVFNLQEVSAQQETEKPDQEKSEMLVARILVLDPDGHPLDGATVTQTGLRTKIEPGSHWGWDVDFHGPPPKVVTNAEGIAEVPVPRYVSEKLETGAITWSVDHPEYVSFRQDRNVLDNPAQIELERGFRIAVTAIDGKTGAPIKTDLFASISTQRFANWELHENGMLVSPVFAEAESVMRLMHMVEGQPVLFSEMIEIKPEGRSRVLLKEVKLFMGTRVEGRLAESVRRPVMNGHVTVTIAHRIQSTVRYNLWNWMDRAPIAEDGAFVFESLPPDSVLQMVPVCDDWVPSRPTVESVLNFFPDQVDSLKSPFSLPQLVELTDETVSPVLEMEPATSVRVTVLDPNGEPLPNAQVTMNPNHLWFSAGSQVLGGGYCTRQTLEAVRADELDKIKPKFRFDATTDEQGVAIIRNLPVNVTEGIMIDHADFELPVAGRGRSITVDLKPDEDAEVTVRLQKKGTDSLGAEKGDK